MRSRSRALFFAFFAWFAPSDIPRRLLAANAAILAEAPGVDAHVERQEVNRALMELAAFSLIRIRQG